jgi:DNA-binding transcriptional regulator YiaG
MTPTEIKALRLSLKLTQQDLAIILGVSVVTVTRWETGVSVPSPLAENALKSIKEQAEQKQ